MNFDIETLTENMAKANAAEELGCGVHDCTFNYDSDIRGKFLRAFSNAHGYSSKYYYA